MPVQGRVPQSRGAVAILSRIYAGEYQYKAEANCLFANDIGAQVSSMQFHDDNIRLQVGNLSGRSLPPTLPDKVYGPYHTVISIRGVAVPAKSTISIGWWRTCCGPRRGRATTSCCEASACCVFF